MPNPVYTPVQYTLAQILGEIELGRLALPELQRPFVWKKTAVRDLLDSMYRGFPVGSLMLWRAAQVDSRHIGADGKQHTPTEFIIDGQQRLTGLYAVIKGERVTFKDFSRDVIRIGFRPRDGHFEVADASVVNDPEYLSNITELWTGNHWEVIDTFVEQLRTSRPETTDEEHEKVVRNALNSVHNLVNAQFQAVQIGYEVDEEQVAEIFLRVNSGGTSLTQADFILTLMSVFREEDRRRLEEFSEASRIVPSSSDPSPFNHLIYPSPDELLRVAVLVGFQRGRLQSVLALLRGASADGEVLEGELSRDEQLDRLTAAIDQVLELTSWHEYLKTVMAAGFRRSTEITSDNNIVLVYALYLLGRTYGLSHSDLRTPIARYFFMSALTGRYTGSFESGITRDVQFLVEASDGQDYVDRLQQIIDATLTDDFWAITLPRDLATAAARSPALSAYAAALCLMGARVPPFGSSANPGEQKAGLPINVLFDPVVQPKKSPIERHHLFPRRYLESIGISGVRNVNQIANLSYVEWPENIEISDTPPSEYWPKYAEQFTEEDRWFHALPDGWADMEYNAFLAARRTLMAQVIRQGFTSIGAAPAVSESIIPKADSDEPQAHYLHPDRPYSNEAAIRKVIGQLRGRIFWYEQHMDRKVLDLLHDSLQFDEIDDVRLLSGPANLSSKAKRAFARFAEELANRGVAAEWRVLSAEDARRIHARVIADEQQTFEIPPLNSVLAGTVDSIHPSEIPMDSFELAWSTQASPLESLETDN
jgi:hypothetical protein